MPALAIYNPPDTPPLRVRRALARGTRFIGKIADVVHDIRYEHAEDGELYEHEFEHRPGVEAYAIEYSDGTRAVLLVGKNNQRIWEEF